jgi:hypothetical protein
MQELTERIKAMAVEAGFLPGYIGDNCAPIQWWHMELFAQAVARECAGVVLANANQCRADSVLGSMLASNAQAIRARFGLATPPADE